MTEARLVLAITAVPGSANRAARHHISFGIQASSLLTYAFAAGLTGMPHASKKGARFFHAIFE